MPVVKDTVIARCRRCRTYINPYVTFIEGGNRWKCPMCNLSNEVPQMFDWDQEKNQPADRWKRAELNSSVVEFIAPTEYMVRPPQPPCYVFLIDVSEAAVKTGMVATAARTILESLDRLPNADGRTKVSIIAVDTALHFFCLPPGSTDPTMLVVSDLEDVFLPKPQDLLVNANEAKPALENLLGRLSDMFSETYTTGSAMGAGLQAAFKLVVRSLFLAHCAAASCLISGLFILAVQHRWKDHRLLVLPPLDRTWCAQEPRRPQAARHVQGVDPAPACQRVLQDVRHRLLAGSGVGRHVPLQLGLHRRVLAQCIPLFRPFSRLNER